MSLLNTQENQTPKISVIVPVYNVESFFEKCLRTLFEQTLDDIEYIFIDDCSSDKSMDILSLVLCDYPVRKQQARIISNEKNLGSGATRSIGMKIATGKYVIHCDSDDWCELNMYEELYNIAVEEKADIVCCSFWSEYADHRVCNEVGSGFEDRSSLLDLKLDIRYSSLCNKIVSRHLYKKHDIYPFEGVNMWEDLGLMTRLRYFSQKTVMVNSALYHYNKLNEHSIVSVPTVLKVEEQMRCAILLESFFQDKKKEFSIVVENLKFMSKSSFFCCKELRDEERWKGVFTEAHSSIYRFVDLPLNMRLIYWFASKGFFRFSCFIFDSKIRLNKFMRKIIC